MFIKLDNRQIVLPTKTRMKKREKEKTDPPSWIHVLKYTRPAHQHFICSFCHRCIGFLLCYCTSWLWSFTFIGFVKHHQPTIERVRTRRELRYTPDNGIYVSVILFWDCNNFMVKQKSLTAIENYIHTIHKMNQISFAYKNAYSRSTAGQFG